MRHWFPEKRDRETVYLIGNMSGLFLALIRISEPMVFQEALNTCGRLAKPRELCCKKKEKESRLDFKRNLKEENEAKMRFSKESLCSFLNSSVNIEYVYLILTGIQKFMINSIENCEYNNAEPERR